MSGETYCPLAKTWTKCSGCPWWLDEHKCCAVVRIAREVTLLARCALAHNK